MKKTYSAPVMEREIFETSDVITVSFTGEVYNAANAPADKNVPAVDVNEMFGE